MKTLISIITLVAASPLLIPALPGQQSAGAGTRAFQNTAEKEQAEARQLLEQARQQEDQAKAEAQQQFERAQHKFAQADQQFRVAQAASASSVAPVAQRLQSIVRRGPGASGKTLVIRSSETDAKEQVNLEEDLAVMSHIFDKTIDENLGEDGHAWKHPMGIDVFFAPSSNPMRSVYLEGYGALFLLNVGIPLLPPPTKAEPQKEKSPVDSNWDQAKQELYGQRTEGKTVTGPVKEYSEEKVNRLKDALLEALKNATNIRNLKPNDSVTVCVFGGASAGALKFTTPALGDLAALGGIRAGEEPEEPRPWTALPGHPYRGPAAGTMMTIRVKKTDVDDFAKGKLNLDEFHKKAKITTYAGGVGGGDGSFVFSGDGFNFNGGLGGGGGGSGGGSSGGSIFEIR